ncbi:YfhO family protein [Turicibacter sanguinis]|nr:YfhO family protein [Turicibacter sanguinis]MTN49651.1 YfhO family protein [Turicibacter sanguinis]MTN52682.1 YfhO family protein [Turicibacter sanguinis]MTN55932.1 YfhO family protein [Turicibacter sanguinis]MTN58996.1 YfhO family protein [Turicibacter sanguinis]
MKKYHYMLILVGIVLLAHLKYVLTGELMIFYGDNLTQVLPFYYHGWDLVHSGELNFWDWTHGLGSSVFSHVYYFLTSPFFWLTTLFPRDVIPTLFLYWYIIKISLIGIFSFLWLSKLNKKLGVAFIGALVIMFSGWVLTYYHFFFFLDAFSLYPLILYAIERYLEEKKFGLMVLLVALITMMNFYFSYQFIPFAMMYSLFRNFLMNRGKEIFLTQLKIIGFYLLGIGIGGLILIPSALIIIQTPRLSESGTSLTSVVTLKQFYRYVTSIFFPVGHRFDPNFLISCTTDPGIGWGGGASLYTTILTPVVVPLLLFLKDKREKMGYVIFLGILSFFFVFKIFYVLLQGSLDTRWMYMFMFLFVMMLTRFLDAYFKDREEAFYTKYLKTALMVMAGTVIVIVWGLYGFTLWRQWNVNAHELVMLKNHCLLASILVIIFTLTLVLPKIKYKIVILSVFIALEGLISFRNLLSTDAPLTKENLDYEAVERSDFFKALQEMDDSFYRVEFRTTQKGKPADDNLPMSSNFKGFRFYTSVYQYSQDQFLSPLKVASWTTSQQIGKENVLNLLAYKYYIDFSGGEANLPYGFQYLTHLNGAIVYENQFYTDLGFTFNQVISESDFNSKSALEQNLLYPYYLVVPDEYASHSFRDINPLEELTSILEWGKPGFFSFEYEEPKEKTMVYVENFGSPDLEVRAYLDGELVFEQIGYQFDYAGFYIEPKFDYLEVVVGDYGDPLALVNIYLDENLSRYDELYTTRQTQGLDVLEFNNDDLKTSITINEDNQWLFTSIPYDKGWSVKVNGEKVQPIKVNQGFLGLQLDAGEYEIEFSYWPIGLNIGIILTACCSGLFIFFLIADRRKRQ